MKRKQLLLLLVLLMTAVTGAWAQTGMTNGLFSVSATKKVHFSKGNLQYDGTNWKFADSQWEVLGANGTGATGTATNYPMDLFTWGNIDSPTYNGTTYYTENADLSGITDWGSRIGSGWYTLSKDEWLYLFGMESNNTDKSGHARYRKYFRAKVNGLPGIVVLPDDLSGISDIPAESSRGTASNFNAKTYTTDAWSAMESAGCVFLPTAGFRKTDASVSHVGWSGFYWASTAYDAGKAYTVGFDNTSVDPANKFDRTFGFPVRLVIDQYYLTLADGTKDADKWTVKVGDGDAQALPIGGLKGDGSETVTLQYNGRLKVKGVTATSAAAPAAGKTVDLSTLTADYEAQNGDVLTGETTSYKVTIAAGATVTLDGVNISSGDYCIKCLGEATIILNDGSTNTLTSTSQDYPALSIGDANTTLTIQGSTGVLNVTSGELCAGIGGGYMNADKTCGNIRIEGGVITAQGGDDGSGIGSDCGPATCGDIIITGGTITAKGGNNAAGIGTGYGSNYPVVCGDITIANTVTKVTATKGTDAPHSIGKGDVSNATCGTVTIGCTLDTNGNPVGGTKYWEDNAAVNGGNTYLATSPLIYEPVTLATPLTIEAITDGTIKVNMSGALTTGMKYSVNGGTKSTITSTTVIGDLKAGDKVQFYGNGTQTQAYGDSPEVQIKGSGDGFQTKVYGNIMSLLDEEGFATKTDLPNANYVFYGLFTDNTTLIDASELLLPAETLVKSCYRAMFVGCTNLIKAPALPATQLAESCYSQMFIGCSALTAAPVLPATQLVKNCYNNMFNNCSKLATVTCLAKSGINQNSSTSYWLQNAGSQAEGTKTFNAVSTAEWPSGFNGIPTDWTRVNIDI